MDINDIVVETGNLPGSVIIKMCGLMKKQFGLGLSRDKFPFLYSDIIMILT